MRKLIKFFFTFVRSILTLTLITFIAWMIANIVFEENELNLFIPEEEKRIIEYPATSSIGKFYYEQLTETQKAMYNGLQENKEKLYTGKYKIEFGNKFFDILEEENGSKILGDDYQTAIEAFTHDNPDLFFLDVSKLYFNIETKKRVFGNTYNVYIEPAEGKTYYVNGFNSESDVLVAQSKIKDRVDVIKSEFTGNQIKDLKIIHDFLVNNVEYDEAEESIGTNSIYGALIDGKCRCEGYARTYKYLIDMIGIENILMKGIATNSDGEVEKHAWNAVKVSNNWYLTDVTWDDPIIIGIGIVPRKTHYKYYLKGTKNFYKDHTLEYQFSDAGKIFSYPEMSMEDY